MPHFSLPTFPPIISNQISTKLDENILLLFGFIELGPARLDLIVAVIGIVAAVIICKAQQKKEFVTEQRRIHQSGSSIFKELRIIGGAFSDKKIQKKMRMVDIIQTHILIQMHIIVF